MAGDLPLNLSLLTIRMDRLFIRASVMDDLYLDIKRTIDDQVDQTESLPYRYQNMLVEVELPL